MTKTTNHYGKWVSSDTPVTGVRSNNNIPWLYEELQSGNEIDLDYEEYVRELELQGLSDEEMENELEFYESSDATYLIGGWILDTNTNQYEVDENSEYSAIVRSEVTQIVWSKTVKTGALCSPCYPGQVDLDSTGDYLAYDLPDDFYTES